MRATFTGTRFSLNGLILLPASPKQVFLVFFETVVQYQNMKELCGNLQVKNILIKDRI